MKQSQACTYCNSPATTRIPVADGDGRVCTRHAEEFWRGVVQTAAELRRLDRVEQERAA